MSEKKLCTCTTETRAIDAFRLMAEGYVDGLPVLNDEGRLETVLSVSNLRGLTYELFDHLLKPVPEFLKAQGYSNVHCFSLSHCSVIWVSKS